MRPRLRADRKLFCLSVCLSVEEPAVADVVSVLLIVAAFAVLALVVKGVERLER
jgi:hypothetical protein